MRVLALAVLPVSGVLLGQQATMEMTGGDFLSGEAQKMMKEGHGIPSCPVDTYTIYYNMFCEPTTEEEGGIPSLLSPKLDSLVRDMKEWKEETNKEEGFGKTREALLDLTGTRMCHKYLTCKYMNEWSSAEKGTLCGQDGAEDCPETFENA